MLPQFVEVAPANWVRLTGEQIVDDRAVVLYGVQIYATADDVITIYDGQNTNAPPVFTIHVLANRSKNLVIDRGLLLTHGLYVGGILGTTIVTVFWRPYQEPIIPSGKRPASGG